MQEKEYCWVATLLIIQLTSHKDLDALDHCLVRILAELAPISHVELIHFYYDKEHGRNNVSRYETLMKSGFISIVDDQSLIELF